MTQWWYGNQGQQMGPVGEDELRGMVAAGQLGPDTMVWREGMPAWQPLPTCLELSTANPWLAGYASPVAPTSGLAIASLICGIVGIFLCYVNALAAVPAVICGHMALRRIRDSQVPVGGRGLAIAGLATGYLGLLAQLAVIGLIAFAVITAGMQHSSSFSP